MARLDQLVRAGGSAGTFGRRSGDLERGEGTASRRGAGAELDALGADGGEGGMGCVGEVVGEEGGEVVG